MPDRAPAPDARRAIICGGRDFVGDIRHRAWLRSLWEAYGFVEVVSGGAVGADRFGELWWRLKGETKAFPADWGKHGKRAGPIRNQAMADYCRPGDLCIAFPGGRGTADMCRRAEARGMIVIKWEDARE